MRATAPGTTDVYFMTLGQPNGVYAIINRNAPGVRYRVNPREDSPYHAIQANFFSALVSSSSAALVQLTGWDIDRV